MRFLLGMLTGAALVLGLLMLAGPIEQAFVPPLPRNAITDPPPATLPRSPARAAVPSSDDDDPEVLAARVEQLGSDMDKTMAEVVASTGSGDAAGRARGAAMMGRFETLSRERDAALEQLASAARRRSEKNLAEAAQITARMSHEWSDGTDVQAAALPGNTVEPDGTEEGRQGGVPGISVPGDMPLAGAEPAIPSYPADAQARTQIAVPDPSGQEVLQRPAGDEAQAKTSGVVAVPAAPAAVEPPAPSWSGTAPPRGRADIVSPPAAAPVSPARVAPRDKPVPAVPRALRATGGGRCLLIAQRAQLGEELTPPELRYLRQGCPTGP
ncbi:hypothetical protein [Roseomonas elaeocarpi]|uniref:Uncharacterized protein n=1 Tax=Roseomonas elaeocarpi TaxID=907779 RepID=A0ABV6JMQ3_9PROT